jgi:undecaprenyl-diphosphatase
VARAPDHPRSPSRGLLGGAGIAGLLALATVLVVVPGGAAPTALDTWVFDVTTDWTSRVPWVVDSAAVLGDVTDVVPSAVLGVVATVWMALRRHWAFALLVACSGLVGVTVVEMLKRTVGRMRPPGADEFISHGLDRSFPSGHASVGVYVYAALAVLLVIVASRRQLRGLLWAGRALFAVGILIGVSRIILGVHWSTDVLAGWALASTILLLSTALVRPWAQPAPPSSRASD